MVLHQTAYSSPRLQLSIAINLNTYPKSRGRSIGPSLEDTVVNSVIVTKETVARLTGQCYQLNGSIDVLVIAFKIFFSQVCKLVDSWKTPIVEEEFLSKFRGFLKTIQPKYKSIAPWPRLLIPHGYKVKRIVFHSDGSLLAASYVMFLVSESDHHVSVLMRTLAPISRTIACHATKRPDQ